MRRSLAIVGCLFALLTLAGCTSPAAGDRTACALYFDAVHDLDALGREILASTEAGEEVSRATAERYVLLDADAQESAAIAYDKAEDADLARAFNALRESSARHTTKDAQLAWTLAVQNAADRCRAAGVPVTYDVRTNAASVD